MCSCASHTRQDLQCRVAPDVTFYHWGTTHSKLNLLPSFPTNFLSQALIQTPSYLRSEICQGHCSGLSVWQFGSSSQILCAFSTGKCHCTAQIWILLRAPAAELPLSQETETSSLRTCHLAANKMTIPLHWGTKLTWCDLGKSCFGCLWLLLDQKKRSHVWKNVLPENLSGSNVATFPS